VRYAVALVWKFPQYIFWGVDQFFSGPFFFKILHWLKWLLTPVLAPVEFIRIWGGTRPLKRLLFALPFLLLVVALLTAIYISKNTRREGVHKNQRRMATVAMQNGDYREAGLLFGKLIRQSAYANDPNALFPAMIVAWANSNQSRAQSLERILVGELNYLPARMWLARQILSSQSGDSQKVQEAVGHLNAVLKGARSTEEKDTVLLYLGQIYMGQKRFDLARDSFEQVSDLTPQASIMLAQVYLSLNNKEDAGRTARELLDRLRGGVAVRGDRASALNHQVMAYIILASVSYVTDEQMSLLDEALNELENGEKYIQITPNAEVQIANAYVQLSRVYLGLGSEAGMRKGLDCLSRSIREEVHSPSAGSILLYSCNQAGDYYVSLEVAQSMLVQGEALVASHLRLGLDAWRLNNDRLATLHFEIAHNINPAAYALLRDVARSLAQLNEASIVDSVRFSLRNESPWMTALGLLSVLAEAEKVESPETLLARCEILASRQKWPQISVMLERKLETFPKVAKARALYFMSVASREMFDLSKAEEYMKQRKELLGEGQVTGDR